ncbi:hypothetical protein XU18_0070 [Perkinsela sp. CCAP 1560/4]|nr:hypothetical protein XU18_0070 [Perkinsela sp. CCAP 1560/4]|eukprot:KNH09385.1 hypothetical protein XU18_0070 [Perkinsela sp. CCAP 1560/4]
MSSRKPSIKDVFDMVMDSHRRIRCSSCLLESNETRAEKMQKILFSMGIFSELEDFYTPDRYADNETESSAVNGLLATCENSLLGEEGPMEFTSDAEVSPNDAASSRHMPEASDLFYDKYRTKITLELERKADDLPFSCQLVYKALESLLIVEKEGMTEGKISQVKDALRIVENSAK